MKRLSDLREPSQIDLLNQTILVSIAIVIAISLVLTFLFAAAGL